MRKRLTYAVATMMATGALLAGAGSASAASDNWSERPGSGGATCDSPALSSRLATLHGATWD